MWRLVSDLIGCISHSPISTACTARLLWTETTLFVVEPWLYPTGCPKNLTRIVNYDEKFIDIEACMNHCLVYRH